jgi:two-component system, chemotaxis family, chemotaxis protein CheY
MKILIVEDDFTGRIMLQKMLSPYGECHVAVNGKEAVTACRRAIDSKEHYNLICLDIVMPEMDGHTALEEIRGLEDTLRIDKNKRARIIMTTVRNDIKSVTVAYKQLCDGYLVKPFDKAKLFEVLRSFKLVE